MSDIADAALTLIGTPFAHQGRKAGVGLDCVGVIYAACERAGQPIEDFRAYPQFPAPAVMLREMRKRFREVPAETVQPGDFVVLGQASGGRHVGIVVDDRHYVEARSGRSVGRSPMSREHIVTAFRIR